QLTHEANSICQRVRDTVCSLCSTDSWVQRSKQRVFNKDAGLRQPVKDGRLTRVRVSRDSNRWHLVSATSSAFGDTRILHLYDVAPQLSHTVANATTVELNLGLTRTTLTNSGATGSLAASLTRHRFTPAAQAG